MIANKPSSSNRRVLGILAHMFHLYLLYLLFTILVGAVLAGIPMRYIANLWEWYVVFVIMNVVCTFVFLMLVMGKDIKPNFHQSEGGPAKIKH